MAFERDWEEFFGKLDRGAPLAPEEEKHARAVRALRASGGAVPAADPGFLDFLSGSLREEYVRSYGAAAFPGGARSGLSSLLRPFALVAAACAALVPAYLLLPRELSAAPAPIDAVGDAAKRAIADLFAQGRVSMPYCHVAADCFFATSMPSAQGASVPYAAVAFAGFLALAAASYAGLAALAAVLALWRSRGCRASSPVHAFGVAAFVSAALAVCAGLGVAYGAADSLGADLSFGADFLARTGIAEPAVFAAALAAAALALVTSAASAARNGPRSFPALVATAAAAPWLPAVCIFLLFPSPSSALANGAFLSLSALAMAASVWPFPGAGNRVDRFFAAASVLAVSFPAYAYFLLPRDATKAEIAACCTAVVAWAAATAFSAARRRGFHPAARVLS